MMLEEERRKREEFEKLQLQKETQLRGKVEFFFRFHFEISHFPAKNKREKSCDIFRWFLLLFL